MGWGYNTFTGKLDKTSNTSKPTSNSQFVENGNTLELYYYTQLVQSWTIVRFKGQPIGLLLALTYPS